MTDFRSAGPDTPLVGRTAEIDGICDRYEAEWRAGRPPAIEELLRGVAADLRSAVEAELRLVAEELRQELPPAGNAEAARTGQATILRAVAACPTFAFLQPASIAALAGRLERSTVPAGTAVLVQAAACPGLQLVLRGRLAIELEDASGRRRRIDEALPGSVVGEIGLLTGRPCTAHVLAVEETDLLVLPAAAFAQLRTEFPELEPALAQVVGDRLGERDFDGLCGKQVGPCRLIRCLGRGGMGVVYEARMIAGGDQVAVKMLRHGLADDPRAVERFRQEAAVLGGLRHPGIAGVADLFVDCRTLFLIMELCPGSDLRRIIAARGPLPPAATRRLLGQIAASLAHAHGRGIVHLDIKPSNVIVNDAGRVKLVDFGLARMLGDDSRGSWSGTPRYMPPEQLAAGEAGPAADWYAWGCLAAELLAGRPLFDDEDLVAMAAAKASWPPPLGDGWAAADPELAAIIAGALHPLPEQRRLDVKATAQWAGAVPELASEGSPRLDAAAAGS
jgi:CRP-like cAMP-binding protein